MKSELLFQYMKNNQKGFLGFTIAIITALILVGGAYVYLKNSDKDSSILRNQQIVDDRQNNVPVKDHQNLTNTNGKCGLTISSHVPNEKFTWPLVIEGKVAPQQSQIDNNCSWQTYEGVSGTAQLYFNENNNGWRPVGNSVIFRPDLSITFNYTEIGLPMNTPIEVVFTEENPAAIRPALVFELPLVLK